MFPRPEIRDLLRQYVLVQLYTDIVPSELYTAEDRTKHGEGEEGQRAAARANQDFQAEQFGDSRLPLYVILEPLPKEGYREVDRYVEGKINNVNAFAEFLKKNLSPNGGRAAALAN